MYIVKEICAASFETEIVDRYTNLYEAQMRAKYLEDNSRHCFYVVEEEKFLDKVKGIFCN